MYKLLERYQNKRKLAFCAATRVLPTEIRMAIWSSQWKGGDVYGNTLPEDIDDLIHAILEENGMDDDTFDERAEECLSRHCRIASIASLYHCFESNYSSNYVLAYINGACFHDLRDYPDAGLEFAKFTQPQKFQRYEELKARGDADEQEIRDLEYECRAEYVNNMFGHVDSMSDEWDLDGGTVQEIVHLTIDILGING